MASSTKKSAFRFNLIDVLLILIALAAAAILAYIFLSPSFTVAGEEKPSSVTIEYEVEVLMLRKEWQGLIDIGDRVVDNVSLYSLGEVIERRYTPYFRSVYDEESDSFNTAEYPDYVTLIFKVRAAAQKVAGDGYLLDGGYELAAGSAVNFRTPSLARQGYCVSVTEVSEDE